MENVHTVGDLRQMQSLPLKAKIRMTEARIEQWYNYWEGNIYISFSGGKDSTVLLSIARKLYPDIKAVYVDTGLEYPEIRDFVKTIDNVEWLHPVKYDKKQRKYVRTSFREVIMEQGYPIVSKEISKCVKDARSGLTKGDGSGIWAINKLNGEALDRDGNKSKYNCPKWKFLLDAPFKISNRCCDIMKKNPTKDYEKKTGQRPLLGTLADESALRLQNWLKTGCNAFNNDRPVSQPLSFWREQDILEYLVTYNIPYASVYGDIVHDEERGYYTTGVDRTGCMFCGFGAHLEASPNRFQKMKETHPKQYEYCLKTIEQGGLGMAEVLDYIGVDYK